jgi:hypothetical protein
MNHETENHDLRRLGAMKFRFVESYLERPPKVRLLFDVMLRNEQPAPFWFLLPDQLECLPQWAIGPVEGVEVYRLEGEAGQIIIGHFRGTGGFYALRLPGNAEVMLRRFPIPMWSPPPESIVIETLTTSHLLIAGEPAENWFEMDPMSDTHADVQADALAEQKKIIAGKSAPGPDELPVTVLDDEHMEILIPLRTMI